jgi:tetratricopeptide (TPR) repeat protein
MMSTLVTRSILTISLTLSGTLAFAQDRVFVKQGTPAQGTITELTELKVVIEVRGKPQTYQLKEVRKITFDKEPVSLDRARDLAIEGKYSQAIEELRSVKQDGLEGRAREDYEFYLAYCAAAQSLAGSGDPNAAIRGLINVDKVTPNGHHRFEVQEMLGRLALSMAQNDKAKSAAYFDRAKTYFEALEKSPEATQKSLGIYYQGSVLHAQGKAAEAKALLKKLLDAQASSPEMARVKNLATILDARCDNETGQSQQALETLNAMAEREDNTDLQLFAKINNARGDCYQTMNQPQRAAYSYLQTDLLFFTDPETHAEALFHLKKLLVTIGEPAKAAVAGERLSKQYASSLWANKK